MMVRALTYGPEYAFGVGCYAPDRELDTGVRQAARHSLPHRTKPEERNSLGSVVFVYRVLTACAETGDPE